MSIASISLLRNTVATLALLRETLCNRPAYEMHCQPTGSASHASGRSLCVAARARLSSGDHSPFHELVGSLQVISVTATHIDWTVYACLM